MAAKKKKATEKVSTAEVKHYALLKSPVITEKGARAGEVGTYVFKIDPRSNKTEIREAIERIFSVKVDSVRTLTNQGKPKRVGRNFGRRDGFKKAYVKLKEGFTINLVEGL